MKNENEFRFSPRPNRAAEIRWRQWSDDAFAQAHAQDKPILLAISAVWCHWCHVMDETSYSDGSVIDLVNERYVPVRVDNDRRPDVNARYNQGGWPTTAFLTPQGALLAGATYLPPEQMRAALEQIAQFYQTNREQIRERAVQIASRTAQNAPSSHTDLDGGIIERVLAAARDLYDPEFGGFGTAPKFPMVDVLDLLLQEYRVSGDQSLYDMLARTLLGMADGGMYDHVEGGFFRYSTTRDWSVPHFEKMTEDHAGLLRVLAGLTRATRNDRFRATLVSALGYVRTVLRDPQTAFFAGSQDADEAYYELPLQERRAVPAPYVDPTSYSNWTAAMAGTFACAADALDDEALAAQAEATLDALHDRMSDPDGLLYHYVQPGGTPSVRGLLTDQAAYLRALLDAHECGGEPRFIARAKDLAFAIERVFSAPDGGFYDHAALEPELGNLILRDRPLADNALLAECFLRLAALQDQASYRETAERALLVFATTYDGAGTFAAPYARALRRYLDPGTCIVLVGSVDGTADLREAARALPQAMLTVRTIDAADASALAQRGFDPALHPAAYICAGKACAAPVQSAAELRSAFEALDPVSRSSASRPNERVPIPYAVRTCRARIHDQRLGPQRQTVARRDQHQNEQKRDEVQRVPHAVLCETVYVIEHIGCGCNDCSGPQSNRDCSRTARP